jgi:hypothetical protein
MLLKYLTINTIAEVCCFIIAIVKLRKINDVYWKSWIVFLFITCVTEFAGKYLKDLYLEDRLHAHPNVWLYNLLLVAQAFFIGMMFIHLLKKYTNSFIIIMSSFGLLMAIYLYELFSHGIYVYNELTNTVMLVIFILLSFLYYYYLLKDEAYTNLLYSADFWWVAGVLFFYFGTTACNIFFEHLSPEKMKSIKHLTYYIYNAFNIVLYGCWSYSFICKRWEMKILPGQLS